jgi:glycosyltransferase involved in cell wall biosynthesis
METCCTDPEFSVIIPARNEELSIPGAIASVLKQGSEDGKVEVIVVANGCTDGTAAVARALGAPSPGVCLTVIEESEPGVARAKNIGAVAARGRWLIFLDADSRLEPGLLSAIQARIEAGNDAGSIPVYADGGDPVDRAFFSLMEFGKRLFNIEAQMFFCPRTEFLEAGGFEESLVLAEDRDLLVRLKKRGLSFGRVDSASIRTSPRRLHRLPLRLGLPLTFGRWALANWGIGRRWRY